MGGIDGRNKDTSVLRCATQLSPQVGRDNGTRAACPSATCDGTEDIKDCKVATTPYTIFGVTSPPKNLSQPEQKNKMRFPVQLFVFLAVAAFHTVLSASLESAEKEEKAAKYDGLAELQKIDQMEFETAQKNQEAHMNATEDQSGDSRYLEAAQDHSVEERVDSQDANAAEGGGNSDAAGQGEAESESSEDADVCFY
ncbi:uncharacterized protein LOC134630886 isoform X3 [Pelmatolapia mariae]|uniref:uncharacterized protein LOC134630886 isoform X3 n=1 Tax=Pelmatolapia mariae TaxID=158779 RepID=UPI002FE6A8FF